MTPTVKTYSKGDLTVIWKPQLCIHSEKCFHGLPNVFDPSRRPWIDPAAASADDIIAQVARCPSGALSIDAPAVAVAVSGPATRIQVLPDGPLLVHGELAVAGASDKTESRSGVTAFCRCGASKNKPYCDGSHNSIGFKG